MRISFDEPESGVQSDIKKTLKREGWFCEKMELPARNGACDLLCLKAGRHIIFEVKRPGEKPRRLQSKFMAEWQAYGGEAYAVESVEDVLRHIS